MRKMWVLCVAAMACCAGWAQEAPKAGPEQAKLKYFVGEWKSEADMKASPMGPAGKYTSTDHAHMFGDFFVMIHSDGQFGGMPVQTAAMMSYDPKESAYLYDEYNSMGEHQESKGTVSGDDWTWTNETAGPNGKMMRGRFSEHIVSPTSYTYKFEISEDGTKWTTIMEGKATKM